MNRLLLCLALQVLSIHCGWKTLLPSGSRGTLIDVTSRCSDDFCDVIFTWNAGDILAVDMMNQDIITYHSSANPAVFNQNITAVAYSNDDNTIFVSVTTGIIYSQPLSSPDLTGWQPFTLPGVSTGAQALIPISSQEGTDLLIIGQNGTLIQADVDYFQSTVLLKTNFAVGVTATATLTVDITFRNGTYRSGVWTGYSNGWLTYTSLIDSTTYTIAPPSSMTSTPVTQLLTYRNNGTVWIIVGQTNGTNIGTAGNFYMIDAASYSRLFNNNWLANPIAMTIMPDLQLIDWLVVATGDGLIKKYNLAEFNAPITIANYIVISQQNLLHTGNQISSLQMTFMTITTEGNSTIVPVLLAISKLGLVSALPAGSNIWQTLVNPPDLLSWNAKIVSCNLVLSTFDSFTSPVYNFIVVLSDGTVIINYNISSNFELGLPSQTTDSSIVKQSDYEQGLDARRMIGVEETTQLGTISFTEICSLINMNTEIYVELRSASTGNVLEFRVVGYETESDPFRSDTQNLILLPTDSSIGMGIGFWSPQEISAGFDTLLDYVDVGLDIFDFVWTVTSLFL